MVYSIWIGFKGGESNSTITTTKMVWRCIWCVCNISMWEIVCLNKNWTTPYFNDDNSPKPFSVFHSFFFLNFYQSQGNGVNHILKIVEFLVCFFFCWTLDSIEMNTIVVILFDYIFGIDCHFCKFGCEKIVMHVCIFSSKWIRMEMRYIKTFSGFIIH